MSWITPLGFLGLIGILILILIYILKPNFQQKFISSTFVWELSLKYKRKKIPINKFRNILLFICQVLAITACAFILAQPVIEEAAAPLIIEKVAIIDAAANMRVAYDEESRFERACYEVETLAKEVFEQEGFMTVIVAGTEASYLVQRCTAKDAYDLYDLLDTMVNEDQCTYGVSDIQGAIDLAQKIVDQNVDAEVFLYTATEYLDSGAVQVVDVAQNGEWNAAILNCEALVEENYYTFKVTVAAYNRDTDLMVHCDVKGANSGIAVRMELPVRCNSDQTKTITFVTQNMEVPVYQFESVHVYVSEADSFAEDNDFFIYGGMKPQLNIQYYSPHTNFFGDALRTFRDNNKRWDVMLEEIGKGVESADIPVAGYDFYVYEYQMPDILPTDGVVMLINLDKEPDGLGLVQGKQVNGNFNLSFAEPHPITNLMSPENIEITQYTRILNYEGFKPLLYCAGDPVLLLKETDEQKIIVMNFSVNFSDLAVRVEFPIMMYNILQYFLPSTLSGYAFDINEEVVLNSRSESLSIESANGAYKDKFETFPQPIVLTQPGSYTLTQTPMSGIPVVEQFFVKIPSSESDISKTIDDLYELIVPKKKPKDNLDLLVYFAAALVALILAERLLQSQDM